MRNSDQLKTSVAADDWPSVVLARPVKVNYSRLHGILFAFVMIFFLAMMCLGANPFERLDWIPADGRGMNPQLQNPGMAIHPPKRGFLSGILAHNLSAFFSSTASVAALSTNSAVGRKRWRPLRRDRNGAQDGAEPGDRNDLSPDLR